MERNLFCVRLKYITKNITKKMLHLDSEIINVELGRKL